VALVPTCVWLISSDLVAALDERFGDPMDAYVNGSQTWIRDDGPGEIPLEWRLHPVAGFRRPAPVDSPYDLFPAVALAIGAGAAPPAEPAELWDGLEAYPAYGDEVEPAPLAAACTAALGLAPDGSGLVDHERIADVWEARGGDVSIVDALLAELG
jgi:hypothetical protein